MIPVNKLKNLLDFSRKLVYNHRVSLDPDLCFRQKCSTGLLEVSLSKFGTRVCECCGRQFNAVRWVQRFCGRDCHDLWFAEERKQALAAWRTQQRYASLFLNGLQPVDEETRNGRASDSRTDKVA